MAAPGPCEKCWWSPIWWSKISKNPQKCWVKCHHRNQSCHHLSTHFKRTSILSSSIIITIASKYKAHVWTSRRANQRRLAKRRQTIGSLGWGFMSRGYRSKWLANGCSHQSNHLLVRARHVDLLTFTWDKHVVQPPMKMDCHPLSCKEIWSF